MIESPKKKIDWVELINQATIPIMFILLGVVVVLVTKENELLKESLIQCHAGIIDTTIKPVFEHVPNLNEIINVTLPK